MRISRACATAVPFLLAAAITACGSASSANPIVGSGSSPPTQLTLYTSVTQDTVTAVLNGFEKLHPGVKVSVFRATTGQLNARIAADQHSGGLRADVIWGTDPLSMESYAQDSLFQPWPLPNLTGVPPQDKTTYFWGTRELYLVIVAHKGLTPRPASWADLTSPAYKGKVALPDPAAAGSAFAALGYFATEPGFSMSFYDQLKANGAVQVSTIPEVVTDVAEGRYQLGITLDSEVRAAIKEGSPVVLDWSELHAGPERAAAAAGFLLLAGNLGGVVLVLIVQGLIGNPYLSLGALSAAALAGVALAARLPARTAGAALQRSP